MAGRLTDLDPLPMNLLDRRSADRSSRSALDRWWEHADARCVAVRDGQVAVAGGLDSAAAAAQVGAGPQELLRYEQHRVLLGVDAQDRPWWLLLGVPEHATGLAWAGLREVGPHLSALQLEAVMTAAALQGWHSRHRFCPGCGERTEPVQGGWVRRCTADGTEHYPRTDPAIIVLVIDEEDRALLARQASWQARWRSTLAGFVEPGESAESAVRREVAEEVGLGLDRLHYVGSQPWPFPGSLMLGFHAWTSAVEIEVDGMEIAEADWFSRELLGQEAASGRIQLPPAISIARRLIERWYGEPLPGSWLRT